MKFSIAGQEKITFKDRWLLKRGDHMGRFECIHTLKKFHASKTKTLNLSVKIEKNNHLISLIIDDLLVPDLFCYNSGDCFITKIQRYEKVEFVYIWRDYYFFFFLFWLTGLKLLLWRRGISSMYIYSQTCPCGHLF